MRKFVLPEEVLQRVLASSAAAGAQEGRSFTMHELELAVEFIVTLPGVIIMNVMTGDKNGNELP